MITVIFPAFVSLLIFALNLSGTTVFQRNFSFYFSNLIENVWKFIIPIIILLVSTISNIDYELKYYVNLIISLLYLILIFEILNYVTEWNKNQEISMFEDGYKKALATVIEDENSNVELKKFKNIIRKMSDESVEYTFKFRLDELISEYDSSEKKAYDIYIVEVFKEYIKRYDTIYAPPKSHYFLYKIIENLPQDDLRTLVITPQKKLMNSETYVLFKYCIGPFLSNAVITDDENNNLHIKILFSSILEKRSDMTKTDITSIVYSEFYKCGKDINLLRKSFSKEYKSEADIIEYYIYEAICNWHTRIRKSKYIFSNKYAYMNELSIELKEEQTYEFKYLDLMYEKKFEEFDEWVKKLEYIGNRTVDEFLYLLKGSTFSGPINSNSFSTKLYKEYSKKKKIQINKTETINKTEAISEYLKASEKTLFSLGKEKKEEKKEIQNEVQKIIVENKSFIFDDGQYKDMQVLIKSSNVVNGIFNQTTRKLIEEEFNKLDVNKVEFLGDLENNNDEEKYKNLCEYYKKFKNQIENDEAVVTQKNKLGKTVYYKKSNIFHIYIKYLGLIEDFSEKVFDSFEKWPDYVGLLAEIKIYNPELYRSCVRFRKYENTIEFKRGIQECLLYIKNNEKDVIAKFPHLHSFKTVLNMYKYMLMNIKVEELKDYELYTGFFWKLGIDISASQFTSEDIELLYNNRISFYKFFDPDDKQKNKKVCKLINDIYIEPSKCNIREDFEYLKFIFSELINNGADVIDVEETIICILNNISSNIEVEYIPTKYNEIDVINELRLLFKDYKNIHFIYEKEIIAKVNPILLSNDELC